MTSCQGVVILTKIESAIHIFTGILIFLIFCRSSPPEVLLVKGVLKICIKITGEHPYRSVISINLICNFIEITLRHGCSPVNLLHIFRTHLTKNISGWLLLYLINYPVNNVRISLNVRFILNKNITSLFSFFSTNAYKDCVVHTGKSSPFFKKNLSM